MLGELSALIPSRARIAFVYPFLCSGNDDVGVRITHFGAIGVF